MGSEGRLWARPIDDDNPSLSNTKEEIMTDPAIVLFNASVWKDARTGELIFIAHEGGDEAVSNDVNRRRGRLEYLGEAEVKLRKERAESRAT